MSLRTDWSARAGGQRGPAVPALAAAGVVLAGAAAGFAVAASAEAFGTLIIAALILAVLGAVVLSRPRLALGILFVAITVVEGNEGAFLSVLQRSGIYGTIAFALGPIDIIIGAMVLAVALRAMRERRLRLPDPFTAPLLLLAVAIVAGTILGLTDPSASVSSIVSATRTLGYLVLLPFLVVNLVETRRHVRVALVLGVALVAYKTLTGLLGFALGKGISIDGTALTYYEPMPNFLLLIFSMTVLAAVLSGTKLPPLAVWLGPVAVAVLILAFRRSWWIALVASTIIVVLVASGGHTRTLLIPAGAVFAVVMYLGFTGLVNSDSSSPIIKRAQTLAPSRIQAKSDDRYRLDEQRNVLTELRAHPALGIGIGVPWAMRHPLPESFPEGRQYVHAVVLWYWLKLGLAGVLAYVWLMGAVAYTGLRLWRRAAHPWYRTAGLGFATGAVGLAFVETTATFTGVDQRPTILLAAGAGIMATMLRLERTSGAEELVRQPDETARWGHARTPAA